MDTAFLLFHLLPAFAMVAYGTYSILEVFFPSLRDPDFGRWEVDDDSGSSIQIQGWKKVLTPPRVMAQGYFSESTACAISLTLGIVMIVAGCLMIRHVAGVPQSFPICSTTHRGKSEDVRRKSKAPGTPAFQITRSPDETAHPIQWIPPSAKTTARRMGCLFHERWRFSI